MSSPSFESILEALPGPARELRGAARSAAPPHQEERGQHLRHPDRAHHRAVPRLHRPDAGAEPRRRGGVPGHGRDADPHQVADAAAAPRSVAGGSPEEDPREALVRRLLEHQKFKAAAELLHERETLRSAQFMRPDGARRRGRRRGARARDRGRSLQPDGRVPGGARARAASGRRCSCRREQLSIEDRIEQLLARLSETDACGFEDLFADVQTRARHDRDVPRAARDDPPEAGARVPAGQLRADPRLQARAAGRRAAAAAGSRAAGMTTQVAAHRCRGPDARRPRQAPAVVGRAQGDRRGADLRLARAADAKALSSCWTTSRRKTSTARSRRCKRGLRPAGRPAVRRGRRRLSDRHAARAARVGAHACSTSGRRRSSRCRRSRRSR